MRSVSLRLVMLAAALALWAGGAGVAHASSYRPEGSLYLLQLGLNDCVDDCPDYPSGWHDLWRLNPTDGAARTRMLATPSSMTAVLGPVLSPAGDALVYSDRSRMVRIASVDLAHMRLASAGSLLAGLPRQTGALTAAWSPDGTRLAFAGSIGRQHGIWIVGRDGTGMHRIACACDPMPWSLAWSVRDQLAFTAEMSGRYEETQLWAVNADGSGLRRLTTPPSELSDDAQSWSPDGTQLVFERADMFDDSSIYALDVATGKLRRLAEGDDPAWSPDGTQIAFTASSWGDGNDKITVVNAADGHVVSTIPLATPALRLGFAQGLFWQSDDPAVETSGPTPSVYASLPDTPAGRAELAGARLALADVGGAVDGRSIQLRAYPAPTRKGTAKMPLLATLDPSVIGYLGEDTADLLDESLMDLNLAGVPQISPSTTARTLTLKRSDPDDWPVYDESGERTFIRLQPADEVGAVAAATAAADRGARRAWVIDDDSEAFDSAAAAARQRLHARRVHVVGAPSYEHGREASRIARGVHRSRANAVLYVGSLGPRAAQLWNAVHRAVPGARLYVIDAAAGAARRARFLGRLTVGTAARTVLVAPDLPPAAYGPAAAAVAQRLTAADTASAASAIAGYEAMALLLDSIHRAGPAAGRDQVRDALFATRDRESVLGRYSIDARGQTNLTREGIYRVRRDGTTALMGTVEGSP